MVQTIPNEPSLVGLAFYLQALLMDPSTGSQVRNALSSALEIHVGS